MPMPTPTPTPTTINPSYEDDFVEELYSDESYSESDSDNSTLDGSNCSDDEEYFIRFDSTTNYDHVDYVMIGSSCYEIPDNNSISTTHLKCQHDVLVYFINGYVDQQMMDKYEINDICRLQGIDLHSHDVFSHLLDLPPV
jgi:hypothetical protein